MDKNHPNEEMSPEDREYEEIRKKTPGLEDEEPEKPENKEDSKEESEEEQEDPEKDTKPQKEEDKSKSNPEKDEEEEEDSKDEEEEDENPKPKRPEKYIPIKQYMEEKKQWRESKESYEKRIGDLEKIANTSDRGTKISDDKIKAYAEKHKLDIDVAKAELERVRDAQEVLSEGNKIPSKIELDEETKAKLEEADTIRAEKMFNDEFESQAVPEIKDIWPNATEKQIKEAKSLIAKKATTKQFIHSELDYVVYKSQKDLATIFESNKGPESTNRGANKGKSEYKASDFKDGKTSFEVISELSSEEQSKIVEDMDVPTYEKYCRFIEQNDKLQINRGGKKIKY